MHKKLIIMCAAIAAFAAFVVAPVASASPVLTSEGKAVAIGTEIKGNNTGVFFFEAGGGYTISCSKVGMTAKVTSNSGTKIKMEVPTGGLTTSGTAVGEDCTASWGPAKMTWGKLCLETVTGADKIQVTGCGGPITLNTNITGTAVCPYTTPEWSGSFVTNADATLLMASQPVQRQEGSGFFCPSEVQFSFDLDLTTLAGGTLFIS